MLLRNKIQTWYQNNRRDLPWRNTSNPYFIWISEIILQQTRVKQGINYYYRFVNLFPSIESLAQSDEETVLKAWQGLGYYSRARNLRQGAIQIMTQYKGRVPGTYRELLNVKGIGEYTAAAIASIAFNEAVAAIDGNVYRVLARFLGIKEAINSSKGKNIFRKIANEQLDKKQPGTYNQALMELGALICTPKKPDCTNCPLSNQCIAYKKQLLNYLPVKISPKTKRTRYFYYFICADKNHIVFQKRTQNDIWRSMFDFPCIETQTELTIENLSEINEWHHFFGKKEVKITKTSPKITHILSHQRIVIQFIHVPLRNFKTLHNKAYLLTPKTEAQQLPHPKPIENYIEKENLLKE